MTAHDHREFVPGCYRCELGRDEAASALAEDMFPGRYVGDLSVKDWERVYAVVDGKNQPQTPEGESPA